MKYNSQFWSKMLTQRDQVNGNLNHSRGRHRLLSKAKKLLAAVVSVVLGRVTY